MNDENLLALAVDSLQALGVSYEDFLRLAITIVAMDASTALEDKEEGNKVSFTQENFGIKITAERVGEGYEQEI